jgi:hypothetical protein
MSLEEARKAALAQAAAELWAERGRESLLPVEGRSMWPVLRAGEQVRVRHGVRPVEIGRIAVLRADSKTIAHRVIARRRTVEGVLLRLKGDASLLADRGWIAEERTLGVVEGVVRHGEPVRRLGIGGRSARILARGSLVQATLLLPISPLVRLVRRLALRVLQSRAGRMGLAGGV